MQVLPRPLMSAWRWAARLVGPTVAGVGALEVQAASKNPKTANAKDRAAGALVIRKYYGPVVIRASLWPNRPSDYPSIGPSQLMSRRFPCPPASLDRLSRRPRRPSCTGRSGGCGIVHAPRRRRDPHAFACRSNREHRLVTSPPPCNDNALQNARGEAGAHVQVVVQGIHDTVGPEQDARSPTRSPEVVQQRHRREQRLRPRRQHQRHTPVPGHDLEVAQLRLARRRQRRRLRQARLRRPGRDVLLDQQRQDRRSGHEDHDARVVGAVACRPATATCRCSSRPSRMRQGTSLAWITSVRTSTAG